MTPLAPMLGIASYTHFIESLEERDSSGSYFRFLRVGIAFD
jgi:hypothetical protein